MLQNSQEKILLNARPPAVQPAVTDIVATRLSSDISSRAFSDGSIIGDAGRANPASVFSDAPAVGESGNVTDPTSSNDSSQTELRFAEAFRIGGGSELGNRKIETIFPVLREIADRDETSPPLKSDDAQATKEAEPENDVDALTRIARLRTALFGSA